MRRIALLGMVAALLLALPSGAQAAGLLAYSDGHSVFSVPADGSAQPHRIGAGVQPAWSPDGRKLAWRGRGGVWVATASGTRAHLLVRGADHPTWSPTGARLAYVRGGAIWTARSDGTAPRLLARAGAFQPGLVGGPPDIADIAWAPNGTRMAVAAGAAGALTYEVNVSLIGVIKHVRSVPQTASIADGSPTIGGPGPAVSFGWLAWSPDSGTLATGATTWGDSSSPGALDAPALSGPYTALVPAAGGTPTFLAPPVPSLTQSGYSPDGTQLCGIAMQGLVVLDLATQKVTAVAAPGASAADFTCSWAA
jgi:hypothetical protein